MNIIVSDDAIKKIITRFHRLEKKNELEVEHLLQLIKTPDIRLVEPLREMSKQYNWQPINASSVLPFATWVEIVCLYMEQGVGGLVASAKKKDEFSIFALSVFDYLPSVEAFEGFVQIFDCLESDLINDNQEFIKKYAYHLCNVSHSLKELPISQELSEKIREILKKIIVFSENIDDETIKISALVPFKYIGKIEDIDFIKNISFVEDCYKNFDKEIVKNIKKRKEL